jgi:nucleoside-diphosphate-sugar epimerase
MLAAAAGQPYHISYGGRFGFQYAEDTAVAFIGAARAKLAGAEVFNLGGETVGISDVIREIEACEPSLRGKITYDDIPLPFPEEIDNAPLVSLLGGLRVTPLAEGVKQTIALFKEALADGRVRVEDAK